MDFINNLENIGIVIYILKILSISIFTYNFAIRIINKKDNKKIIICFLRKFFLISKLISLSILNFLLNLKFLNKFFLFSH